MSTSEIFCGVSFDLLGGLGEVSHWYSLNEVLYFVQSYFFSERASISELITALKDFYCENELSRAKAMLLDKNNPWFVENLSHLCVEGEDGCNYVKNSLLKCDPLCDPKERLSVDILILMEEILNAPWPVTFVSKDHNKVPTLPIRDVVSLDKLCQTVEGLREEVRQVLSGSGRDTANKEEAQPINVSPPQPATNLRLYSSAVNEGGRARREKRATRSPGGHETQSPNTAPAVNPKSPSTNENGWTTVKKRTVNTNRMQKQNRTFIGSRSSMDGRNSLLESAKQVKPFAIFVTRLKVGTTSADVKDYLVEQGFTVLQHESLQPKFDSYASVKIVIDNLNCDNANINVLDPMVWPKNVLVRDFYRARKRVNT